MIVLAPDVVTVGEPVVVPLYLVVGTDKITTPEPPIAEEQLALLPFPPAPPPVFAVPATPAVVLFPAPPPPAPPVPGEFELCAPPPPPPA